MLPPAIVLSSTFSQKGIFHDLFIACSPAAEALTLAEVKAHLRLDGTDEDAGLGS